jgi:DNA-binding MurR/RpiR family transcriptional regulator
VNELKSRCGALNEDQKRTLVLELFEQDVKAGLDAAVAEKLKELARFIERLWDKYRVTLGDLRSSRQTAEDAANTFMSSLGYQ